MPRWAVRTSVRLYRWLQCAYPGEFREEFGAEMTQVFRDRCQEVIDAPARSGLLGLWVHTLSDFGASVLAEQLDSVEATMNGKLLVGLVLVCYALGNIIYDAVADWATMGMLAMLVTVLAAAIGGVLLGRNWGRSTSAQ